MTTTSESILQARIKELEEKLKVKQTIGMKVSEKGALSLYGIGRFPVTLYVGQWERVLAETPRIKAFMKEHEADLVVKE